MTEAERDAFVEDKLACEHEKHLRRQEKLLDATRKVLEQKDLNGLLQTAADAARELIEARYAATGHGYVNGVFTVGGVSHSKEAIYTSLSEAFNVGKGGMYLDMLQEKNSIRFTDAEMHAHSVWSGLPKGHVPLRGLLGARLVNANGRPNGLMMVSDKEDGGDFTVEDETILSQLAAFVSLALQHVEALIEAENGKLRLEAVMEALPVGVAITDAKGGNIQSNSAFEKVWGGPRPVTQSISDYAAYKAWWADTGKPVAPEEWASAKAVQIEQVVVGQVMEIQRFDGTRGFVINSGAPVRDASGNIVGSAVAIQDITERKRAEEALCQSEERFRKVFEHTAFGMVLADMEGRVLESNPAMERMLGYNKDELRYKLFSEFTHPDDVMTERPQIEKLIAGQTDHYDIEKRYIRKDGQIIWVRLIGSLTRDNSGRPLTGIALIEDITKRKLVEEELSQSRARLAWVLDKTGVGMWLNELPLGHLNWDEQTKHLFFIPLDAEPTIELFWSRVHPEDREPTRLAVEKAIRDRTLYEIDHRAVNPDTGEVRWIHSAGQAIYTPDGTPVLFDGINYDITERKKAEEELAWSKQKLADVLDSIQDDFYVLDHDWNFVYASRQFTSRIGKEPKDFVGNNIWKMFPKHIGTVIEENYRATMEKGEVRRFELSGKYTDAWYSMTSFPSPEGITVLGTDITQRKQIEDELRRSKIELEQRVQERTADLVNANEDLMESEERFRVALKNSPIIVFNQDKELRYTWVYHPNPGFTIDATLGKKDEELLPHEDAAQLSKIKSRVLESGFGERAEVRTTVNGEEFFYDLTVEPLRSPEGKIEGITCSSMDITYRKKAEEELRRAKEAAEAAARAKAEFLANMSHEIRTPMNAIIGMTGLLLEEPLTPEQRDNLEIIRTDGDALLTIINDILDFSKMESDKVVLEENQFNLRQCVEESLDLVAVKASEKGINLAYTIDESVPDTIKGDFSRLRQILGNLLSNAVKFTDEGEVILSVSVDGANEVHFAVEDTGIGIPQDSMDQLFQPFSQMELSTTRLYGGTGLGLAISKNLVKLMGGRIWAESEVGKGSMFHFTIRTSSGQFEQKYASVSPRMIGKRVLIVEDNKTNRRILSKQVYDWGMIPMAITSGQEAIKYIQRGDDFDIAILDMDLQDITGLELEDEIRKYNRTMPLVLLVSLGKRIPPNHAYLTKPIKPSQLYKVLTDILPRQTTKRVEQAHTLSRPGQISPLRILLAEDNVSSQKVALQMLKKLGYKADTVANGIEALQALERQHYDIVLMDVKMPEMDGLEATRIIRQRWQNGPKIIAITAYALAGDRERFIEAGMDDYISKPVQKEDLAKVLMKYG